MGDWPIISGVSGGEIAGKNGANTYMLSIPSHASANTKGNWTQLLAATTMECTLVVIYPSYADAPYDYLIDIGIGGAGSEVPIISNIHRSSVNPPLGLGPTYVFPIHIPSGTRISARCQCTTGSKNVRICIQLLRLSDLKDFLGSVYTYGAATADSGGTSVDPGASANTKGSWAQLSASITAPIKALILTIGNQLNAARAIADWLVDVGYGSAGNEAVIIPNIHFWCDTNSIITPQSSILYPVSIPIGSRLAVRAQASINDATDRIFDAIIHGVC